MPLTFRPILQIRYFLRRYIFCCFLSCGLFAPWPGDPDHVKYTLKKELDSGKRQLTDEEKIEIFVTQIEPTLRKSVQRLIRLGCAGEMMSVAINEGVDDELSHPLEETDVNVLLKIFRVSEIQVRCEIDPSTMYPPYPDLNPFYKPPEESKDPSQVDAPGDDGDESPIARVESSYSTISKNSVNAKDPVYKDKYGNPLSKADVLQNQKDMDDEEGWSIWNFFGRIKTRATDFFIFLSTSWLFDYIVYAAIFVSSFLLAAETPAKEIATDIPQNVIILGGFVCNGVFVVEFLSKVIAFGMFFPSSEKYPSYFGDSWNRIDFFVLVISIFDTVSQFVNVERFVNTNILRILRLLRAFRPLKMMNRNKGMKTIVSAIISSAKPITYAVGFLLLIITVFAVMGVALYKQTFKFCNDGSLDGELREGMTQCSGTFMIGEYPTPRAWLNPSWNFDTFPTAVLSLLRVCTLKWMVIWYSAQDRVEPSIQPLLNNNSVVASIYLVLFIFIGSFFGLNLFVSFIVDGFYTAQGVDSKFDDIAWATIQSMTYQKWPTKRAFPPRNMFSTFMRKITNSERFKFLSATFLIVNILCMTMQHRGSNEMWNYFLDLQNNIFFGLMAFESFLVLLGWGPKLFWADGGNRFDIFLISLTAFCMVAGEALRSAAQGVRVLRLIRFVRQMQTNKLIKAIFETVALSAPQVRPTHRKPCVMAPLKSTLCANYNAPFTWNYAGLPASQSIFCIQLPATRIPAHSLIRLSHPAPFRAQVVNIAVVLFLAMSIFAVIGVSTFGTTRHGVRLQSTANFQSYSNAMLTLWQILFGDDWMYIMDDCNIAEPYCTFRATDPVTGEELSYGDCGSPYSPLFFILFIVTCNWTMMNLFVGMIINNFAYCSNRENEGSVTDADLDFFVDVWTEHFDPDGTSFINLQQVYQIMWCVSPRKFIADHDNG